MYRVGFLISSHRRRISISDFERACGLSNGYVHKIKNSVGKRGLLDIQRKFPELNTDWLLTGEGRCLTIHLHILPIATIMELL